MTTNERRKLFCPQRFFLASVTYVVVVESKAPPGGRGARIAINATAQNICPLKGRKSVIFLIPFSVWIIIVTN